MKILKHSWVGLILDIIVPFGPFLRKVAGKPAFFAWGALLGRAIAPTFLFYWLFSLIPGVGTLAYALVLLPLAAWRHIEVKAVRDRLEQRRILLLYLVVIVIGFGGLWNFIGHTVMAEQVATLIGWETSPFQTELAFYTLGTAIVALMAVWLRGHLITAVVISKSVFWLGAAYVHIVDAVVHHNFAPYNVGAVLIGDLVFPVLFLSILYPLLKQELRGQKRL